MTLCAFLVVAAIAAGLAGVLLVREIRAAYQDHICGLELELDQARAEIKTLHCLLIPGFARAIGGVPAAAPQGETDKANPRIQAAQKKGAQAANVPPGRKPSPLALRFLGGHIPFRKKFNETRRSTNSPQQHIDALASALKQQIIVNKEKDSNVTT